VLEALHAVSQPLTILRAGLGLSEVTGLSVEDLRTIFRRSSKEVERLCVLFDYVQKFVEVESIESEPEIEDLSGLVKRALEGVNLLFAVAGVALTCQNDGEAIRSVLVDSSRVEQALAGILIVRLGQALRGDEVIVRIHGPGACIEVVVESALAGVAGTVVANARLSMALAAANLRSQGAHMTWKDNPFSVQITLPVADTPVSA
jgi:hypothetical protein